MSDASGKSWTPAASTAMSGPMGAGVGPGPVAERRPARKARAMRATPSPAASAHFQGGNLGRLARPPAPCNLAFTVNASPTYPVSAT